MLKNLVEETAAAPGTNPSVTFGGAPSGRFTWRGAGFTNGAQAFYFITDGSVSEWGIGTVTLAAADSISRDTVLGNSSGNNLRVNFTSTCRVYNALPAERALYVGQSSMTVTGNILIQKASPAIILDKTSSGQAAQVQGKKNGSNRWSMELGNSASESTGNLGSDFSISRYNDAGTLIDTPFAVARSNGVAYFSNNPQVYMSGTHYSVWHAGNFDPATKQASLGFTPVNKAGDTVTGALTVSGTLTTASDMYVYRSATPALGAVFLGNTGTRFLYWDGTNYSLGGSGNVWTTGNFDPSTKQATLGFTPVQQGTGTGQLTNTIKLGWSTGGRLKATVDTTDLGNVVFDSQLAGKADVGHTHSIYVTGVSNATNYTGTDVGAGWDLVDVNLSMSGQTIVLTKTRAYRTAVDTGGGTA